MLPAVHHRPGSRQEGERRTRPGRGGRELNLLAPSAPLPAAHRRELEGFVLAGGASSRFGGDKALAREGGAPYLVLALEALASLGLNPRVVARHAVPYARWARAFVTSERPGRGPAEGLLAALGSTSRRWALVLAVDMPGVNGGVLRRLLAPAGFPEGASDVHAVCFAGADGRRHPFPGLYSRDLLPRLETLAAGASMQSLLDAIPHRTIDPERAGSGFDPGRALRNVNRREDRPNPP